MFHKPKKEAGNVFDSKVKSSFKHEKMELNKKKGYRQKVPLGHLYFYRISQNNGVLKSFILGEEKSEFSVHSLIFIDYCFHYEWQKCQANQSINVAAEKGLKKRLI